MKIRVLTEQQARRENPDRGYLASGSEVDIDAGWAKELLSRGEAEPIAGKASSAAEKRVTSGETR